MRTKLFVRDSHGVIIGEIADFTQFDMIKRCRDVSSWSISLPLYDTSIDLAQPGSGIVVERDGKTILSGPMNQVDRQWAADKDDLTISGFSDEIALWDRIVYPEPNGRFQNQAYDVFTGPAETAMRHYVDVNVVRRTIPTGPAVTLAVGDKARGNPVTGRGRLQTVGELLQELAIAGGQMNFSVVDLVFDVAIPRDLRASAIFSTETGNLAEYSYSMKAPTATDIIVGGGGELTDRKFLIGDDPRPERRWGRRIEFFRDRRDTIDNVEMTQSAIEEIISQGEQNSVTLKPIDVPGREYGTDYEVNDLVTVEGIEARITEVQITLDENGETVIPSVSSTSTVAAPIDP